MVCKVYVTVIRGTPMMVQLLIMGFVIFASSRNHTMVGALALGINSGAYVAEIIRGGLMSLDPGQTEAGRSLGLGYLDHHALHCGAPGFQGHSARPGQRVHHPAEGHLSDLRDRPAQEIVYFAQAIVARTYERHVSLPHHRGDVSDSGADLHLAPGDSGKEAARKVIDVKGLTKSFGDHQVLKGITEHIHKGEKVVIIGPSGSGKSTFLRCLNLLEDAHQRHHHL